MRFPGSANRLSEWHSGHHSKVLSDVPLSGSKAAAEFFLELARYVVASINTNPLVDDQQRMTLGLSLRKKRAKRHVPESAPGVSVLSRDGTRVTYRLHNRDTSGSRARPATSDGATIFTFVGEQPPADLRNWTGNGNVGRPKFEVTFPVDLPPGTAVWLCARWYNVHGAGPVSSPMQTFIAGGGLVFLPQVLAA